MPKNNVDDLITDQEIAFARLVFSGTMTDRQAAEAVGLNPDTASYTKSKPCVRAWMLEHRAAVEKQLVEQETQELRRCGLARDRVLARLWQIADLDPEMTRNSASSQVKALSMIIAIEGLIPLEPPTAVALSPLKTNPPRRPLTRHSMSPPGRVPSKTRRPRTPSRLRTLPRKKPSKKPSPKSNPLPAGPMTRLILPPTQLQ